MDSTCLKDSITTSSLNILIELNCFNLWSNLNCLPLFQEWTTYEFPWLLPISAPNLPIEAIRRSDQIESHEQIWDPLNSFFFQLPDLIGAIGGHLGLWIGMSIVSFLEVFELIGSIFGACCRMLCCRRRNNVINVKGG